MLIPVMCGWFGSEGSGADCVCLGARGSMPSDRRSLSNMPIARLYSIRRQYKTRCALAEHCRPLAANLKVRHRGSPAEGIPLPEGGEQHWLEETRRLQLDSLGGGHLRRQRTVQHVCSDPALDPIECGYVKRRLEGAPGQGVVVPRYRQNCRREVFIPTDAPPLSLASRAPRMFTPSPILS